MKPKPLQYVCLAIWISCWTCSFTLATNLLLQSPSQYKTLQRITVVNCVINKSNKQIMTLFLTFVGPCITTIFAQCNQQNATFLNLFISVKCSTCFRRFFCPSSGAQNCTYSIRYWSDKYLTLYVQFWAPDDGQKNRLKHVECLTEINKFRNVTSANMEIITHTHTTHTQTHIINFLTVLALHITPVAQNRWVLELQIYYDYEAILPTFSFSEPTKIFHWCLSRHFAAEGHLNLTLPNFWQSVVTSIQHSNSTTEPFNLAHSNSVC